MKSLSQLTVLDKRFISVILSVIPAIPITVLAYQKLFTNYLFAFGVFSGVVSFTIVLFFIFFEELQETENCDECNTEYKY